MSVHLKTDIPITFKGIGDNHNRLHPQWHEWEIYWRVTRLDTVKGEMKILLHHITAFRIEYILLIRSRSGVGVGVGVDIFRPKTESEPESLKIRQLRSPAENNSIKTFSKWWCYRPWKKVLRWCYRPWKKVLRS